MPAVGFEPKISAGERPKTYALDREATGTGSPSTLLTFKIWPSIFSIMEETFQACGSSKQYTKFHFVPHRGH